MRKFVILVGGLSHSAFNGVPDSEGGLNYLSSAGVPLKAAAGDWEEVLPNKPLSEKFRN